MDQQRLHQLQQALQALGVQAFIQPVNDEFQGEYPPPHARRLEWLTGFSGSAGIVAVTLSGKAVLFTDGRYTLQALQEAGEADCEHFNSGTVSIDSWLAEHMEPKAVVGYDPFMFTDAQIRRYIKSGEPAGVVYKALAQNPIDALWQDRPAAPSGKILAHSLKYSGEESSQKIARISIGLSEKGVNAAILTAPDSVNWLLNIRGSDVPNAPIALCYAIISVDGTVTLFVDSERVSEDVRKHLGGNVTIASPTRMESALAALKGHKVLVDTVGSAIWFRDILTMTGAIVIEGQDPCVLPKACKNTVELDGMRAAHVRDGAAVVKLLHWLDQQKDITELDVVEKLLTFRAEDELFVEPSFPTISGSGPNGAIVHYRATQQSNRKLDNNSLFLLDSGGQYPDGTTDITRTIARGNPTAEMKERFNRVLKGHIALATAIFPMGTSGSQLDALARTPLWNAGLDYDHGTGHGVGSFLSVHEGPQRISKRGGDVALKPGMIISNEPGYYKTGAYGIRIENLVAVLEMNGIGPGVDKPFFGFETITLAPIDTRAVDGAMLTADEKLWLNNYHARVMASLSPLLNDHQKEWLAKATRAI